MLALKRVCAASHNRRKEMSWGYCQGSERGVDFLFGYGSDEFFCEGVCETGVWC
jgi:hypothetical protein